MKRFLVFGLFLAISPSVAFAFKDNGIANVPAEPVKVQYPLLSADPSISTLPTVLTASSEKIGAILLKRLDS